MKRTPIIMQAESVLGILAGRKTQTRRIIKPQPQPPGVLTQGDGNWRVLDKKGMTKVFGWEHDCPYGKSGDQLVVKEKYAYGNFEGEEGSRLLYAADDPPADIHEDDLWEIKWLSPRFMPWALSRITLELTEVRVQRLQDINDEDAKAEGVEPYTSFSPEQIVPGPGFGGCRLGDQPYRLPFADLWDSINGEGAWDKNPWVWALTFKRVEA